MEGTECWQPKRRVQMFDVSDADYSKEKGKIKMAAVELVWLWHVNPPSALKIMGECWGVLEKVQTAIWTVSESHRG